MATDRPRLSTSRSRVTTTSCCSRMPSTDRTVSTASKDSARRAGPAHEDLVGLHRAARSGRRRVAGGGDHPVDVGARRSGRRPGWPRSCGPSGGRSSTLPAWLSVSSSTSSASSSMVRFSTAPSESTTTSRARRGASADHLHRADGGRLVRGADHHGGVGGQLRQQAGGPLEHRLPSRRGPGRRRWLTCWCWVGPSTPGCGQVVDEEAVALVGRDPAGAGVGLHQIAVPLEGHHFGAHGGRGDLHPGGVGHVGGARPARRCRCTR